MAPGNYSKQQFAEASYLVKICIFTTVHRPFDVRVFHREARSLSSAGYRVVIIAHADFTAAEKCRVLVKGVPIPKNRAQRILNTFRFLKLVLREKADLYHFHDLELLPCGVALKWLSQRSVIYDCHENFPETSFERVWYPDFLKPLLSKVVAILEPLLARRLDAVICVVPDQKSRFDEKGCRTVMVRNFPRMDIFDEAYVARPAKQNRLIFTGGLTIVKGAMMLVDIMRQLRERGREVRLVAIGAFNEPKVEHEVFGYVQKCGLDAWIEFVPYMPHEKIPPELIVSRIALVPWQRNEQTLRMFFPNKVFEYMACGLPIVASDLPSLRHVIGQAECGLLVSPDNAEAQVQAIEYLLDHPQKAARMGQRGRRVLNKLYRWENEEMRLLDLYASLLGRKQPPGEYEQRVAPPRQ